MKNTLISYLELLKVKHTKTYSEKYYNEHPHKNNLLGLSKMLSDYGVKNAGIKFNNPKEKLHSLEPPFIAHFGNDFVVVDKLYQEDIRLIWKNNPIRISIDKFNENWSGIVLLAEAKEDSIEPDYRKHRSKELYVKFEKYLLFTALSIVLALLLLSQQLFRNTGLTLLFFVNLLGAYISYLLVLKQMHIGSNYADKLCSLFRKQGDCNTILESRASGLWGVIGWSEVGFGYFISNLMLLLLLPDLVPYSAILNLCTLPYTVWSIRYQKVKAKQWCVLCLIVQALLWGVFCINLFSGYVQIPSLNLSDLLRLGCLYLLPVLTVNLLVPALSKGNRMERVVQSINSIKANEGVFLAFLKQQPYHRVDKEHFNILWGNPESKITLTVLTNPHCEPCSRMHQRIGQLLDKSGNKFCVQYIFTSFNEDLEPSSRFLIDIYRRYPVEKALEIYDEWFEGGKYQKEALFKKYDFEPDREVPAYSLHRKWQEEEKLTATPIVMVNGYELPDHYKIEDLKYFIDLEVDSK
jgi:hypothetical protein